MRFSGLKVIDSDCRESFHSLQDCQIVRECVHAINFYLWIIRYEVLPIFLSRRGNRSLNYLKILGVFVRDDKEAIAVVFDIVEEVRFAGADQRQRVVRPIRVKETDLTGEFTLNRYENEFLIARFT